jgi:hypothetical protein
MVRRCPLFCPLCLSSCLWSGMVQNDMRTYGVLYSTSHCWTDGEIIFVDRIPTIEQTNIWVLYRVVTCLWYPVASILSWVRGRCRVTVRPLNSCFRFQQNDCFYVTQKVEIVKICSILGTPKISNFLGAWVGGITRPSYITSHSTHTPWMVQDIR